MIPNILFPMLRNIKTFNKLQLLAQRFDADMLTVLDAKDSSGNAVAVWYDHSSKRFIIGKSTGPGQMYLLTIAGKMAWFHQAGQPGLLFAEVFIGDPNATMKHITDG